MRKCGPQPSQTAIDLIVYLQDYRIKEESVSTFPEVNYDIHRVRYTYKLWYANIKTQKIRHNPPPPQTPPQSVDLFTENTPHIFVLEHIFGLDELTHRVNSRPNWDPHPLTRRRVCPLPLWLRGGGEVHSLAGEGGGGVEFGRGAGHLWYCYRYSRYLCTLWAYPSRAG